MWWGHRIPAWFDDDGNVFVAESEEAARAQAGDRALRQDEDVLDTWFSSALWPFATLGWPEDSAPPARAGGAEARSAEGEGMSSSVQTSPPPVGSADSTPPAPAGGASDLARHYPNDILISGFDILFFWDARMAMQGIEFMGAPPWKTLYLHGLVRDAAGQKMSKSKGNTVDPLGLIDRYGADALRFTMAAMESQGRDIKLDEKRVEGYRNFATKLWNAARFLQGNGVGASTSIAAPEAKLPVNRWIIGEVVETLAKLDKAIADLRFDDMADAIYHFTWGTFCDWYVELIKGEFTPPARAGGKEARSAEGEGLSSSDGTIPPPVASGDSTPPAPAGGETRTVAAWAFDQILVMLHPFMPFITEELWHSMGERPYELIVAKWPAPEANRYALAADEMNWLTNLIGDIRAARTELNVPPGEHLIGYIEQPDQALIDRLSDNQDALLRIAKVSWEPVFGLRLGPTLRVSAGSAELVMPLQGAIDVSAEKARLAKAIAVAEKDRDGLAARLANPAFAERAKPEAVAKAREDHNARAAEAERLGAALKRLG